MLLYPKYRFPFSLYRDSCTCQKESFLQSKYESRAHNRIFFSIYKYGTYSGNEALIVGDGLLENTLLLSLEIGITRFLDIYLLMHGVYNRAAA